MLWNPGFVGVVGSKPDVSSNMPTIGSPIWALDTSAPSTFFTDTGGTTAVSASGQAVARVNSALGGPSSFQQATAGSRPVLVYNAAGTQAGLRFDGTKAMSMTGIANPGTLFQSRTFTMAMSVRISGRPQWAAHFAAGNAAGGSGGAGYDNLLIEANANGWPRVFRSGGSDTAQVAPANAVYSADGQIWKTVVRSSPADGMELRTKSASGYFTGVGPLPSSADSFTWDACWLGAELGQGGSSPPQWMMVGDWYELRFWNTRADDATLGQLQGYLDLKYGG